MDMCAPDVEQPVKPRFVHKLGLHAVAMTPRLKRHLRWALIHCALMFFFADLLAAVWPPFEHVWGGIAHLGVAVAACLATLAEYLHDEAEGKS